MSTGFLSISGGAGETVVTTRTRVVPPSSPFADVAARDVWATANLSQLFNSVAQVTTVSLESGTVYEWAGDSTPSSYTANGWVAITLQGLTLSADVEQYDALMLGEANTLQPLGVKRLDNGNGDIEFDETARFPQESVQIGSSGIMSSFGAIPQIRSFVSGRKLIQPFTYWSKVAGTERTREIHLDPSVNTVAQPDDSTAIPLSGTFSIVATSSEALTDIYFRMQEATGITGLRFRATIQGQTQPFYYYPSLAGFNDGVGVDFQDTGLVPNEIQIDIQTVPIIAFEANTIIIDYAIDSGSLLGDGSTPYLAADRNIIRLIDLAYLSEIGTDANPSVASFNIAGQNTQVDAGTTLSGVVTFNYTIENVNLISGNGTITKDGVEIVSNVNQSLTTIDGTIPSDTLAAGETTTFRLSFPTASGGTVTRDFTVTARQQSETLYYEAFATNVSVSEPVGSFSTEMVSSGTQFDVDFVIPASGYAIILVPANLTITSIIERTFGGESLSDFTVDNAVRVIGGQGYDAYIHQNNAQTSGTLSLRITVG